MFNYSTFQSILCHYMVHRLICFGLVELGLVWPQIESQKALLAKAYSTGQGAECVSLFSLKPSISWLLQS